MLSYADAHPLFDSYARYLVFHQAMQRHPFQPEICAESTKIHMESNKGDFLQRVARDAARKEHEVIRQKVIGSLVNQVNTQLKRSLENC